MNRRLNNLCIPFLFHDLNLLDNSNQNNTVAPITPYTSHVKCIRLLLDPSCSKDLDEADYRQYEEEISMILQQCNNATSLALYYNESSSPVKQVGQGIINLMRQGNIRNFGIYSNMVIRVTYGSYAWDSLQSVDISRLLDEIFAISEVKSSLKNLDIVMETIPSDLYIQVRSLVNDLTSLTVRRAFRISNGHIWDPYQGARWSPSSQLQRLNLIDCSNAYAADIPELVDHFKALRYLIVSTCGDESDPIPETRPKGWSRSPDALCNRRTPLDEFHFERLYEWEIVVVGTIPTKRLMISSSDKKDLISVLEKDKEVFPGLEYIGIAEELRFRFQQPITLDDLEATDSTEATLKDDLVKICMERDVMLNLDVEPIGSGVAVGGL
jgi:hypothetical protein